VKQFSSIAVAVAMFVGASAHAVTVNGSDFTNGLTNQTINGIDFTATGGSFLKKVSGPSMTGIVGVGVSGPKTPGEIDIRTEAIGAAFSIKSIVDSFTVGLLYNGPENNDVLETAKLTVTTTEGVDVYYLKATMTDNVAEWFKGATSLGLFNYTAGYGNDAAGKGAVVQVTNPFGKSLVTGITFEAAPGDCGVGLCSNQSDYTLAQIVTTPIPEPGTYALMLAGLAAVGFVARRRSPR
jgi:hypothetical protein